MKMSLRGAYRIHFCLQRGRHRGRCHGLAVREQACYGGPGRSGRVSGQRLAGECGIGRGDLGHGEDGEDDEDDEDDEPDVVSVGRRASVERERRF